MISGIDYLTVSNISFTSSIFGKLFNEIANKTLFASVYSKKASIFLCVASISQV